MTSAANALAFGWGVSRLVPGDPGQVRALAGSLTQFAEVTADAAIALSRIDPEWTGPAYQSFWVALTARREGFLDATRAFDAASAALVGYAGQLEAAKIDAGIAAGWWQAGIDEAAQYEMQRFLDGRSFDPPVQGSTTLAFSPGGARLRADAATKLEAAWADVDAAARAAIDALVAAQDKAPQAPHWWDSAAPAVVGLVRLGDTPVKREFSFGAVRGLIDLGTAGARNRTVKAVLDRGLDQWEKSHGINPHGGVHAIGGVVGTLLVPGFGVEGLSAGLATKLANRSLTRLLAETETALAAEEAAANGVTILTNLEQGAAKVPGSWGAEVTNKKGVGTRWTDPTNQGNGIRIDEGIPQSAWPSQQVDHVVVRSGGQILGADGKPIVGSLAENPQAHIPLITWLRWADWNTP